MKKELLKSKAKDKPGKKRKPPTETGKYEPILLTLPDTVYQTTGNQTTLSILLKHSDTSPVTIVLSARTVGLTSGGKLVFGVPAGFTTTTLSQTVPASTWTPYNFTVDGSLMTMDITVTFTATLSGLQVPIYFANLVVLKP